MSFNPLEPVINNDQALYEFVQSGNALAFEPGALGKMEKLLIALALDAAAGASNGVRSLALQAIEAGASKAQILEALRVTAYISGAGSVYTAAAGLRDVF